MRFYTKTHQYYCGIDLHAKTMYVCVMNQNGDILVLLNIRTDQKRFLGLVEPYRDDLVVTHPAQCPLVIELYRQSNIKYFVPGTFNFF